MGVLGPIREKDLGLTLIHEHVMADFIGAAQTGPRCGRKFTREMLDSAPLHDPEDGDGNHGGLA